MKIWTPLKIPLIKAYLRHLLLTLLASKLLLLWIKKSLSENRAMFQVSALLTKRKSRVNFHFRASQMLVWRKYKNQIWSRVTWLKKNKIGFPSILVLLLIKKPSIIKINNYFTLRSIAKTKKELDCFTEKSAKSIAILI